MANRSILSVGRGNHSTINFDYDIMLEDAIRYYNVADASGVVGFTITHINILIRANSSWDDIFFVRRRRLPVYPHHFDPLRIVLGLPQPLSSPELITNWRVRPRWAVQRISNQDLNILDDTHYILNYTNYADMRGYVINELNDTATGLVAIPCKDKNNNFYLYLGIYKINAAGTIKNQTGQTITIYPGGPGGEGDSAGARIPAP